MSPRILLAKGGLDGHNRGIIVVAQALRDAGVEVIYGGLYCSPEEIAAAAVTEDVDMVGISIHSGAHLTVFSDVLRLLKEKTSEEWFVFGGGIVPQKDIAVLEGMGVKKIFLPGTDTRDIVEFVGKESAMLQKPEPATLRGVIKKIKNGDVLAASRLITMIQRGNKKAKRLASRLPFPGKDTFVIGVTGPGGVGKSSLINNLISAFLQEGKSVGVIACDPASHSGGAFLGDRIRMRDHALESRVFIRSLAQYENFKGVTPETPGIIKVLGAMKKDVIIVESVGVGQADLGFKDLVKTLIVVLMPGLGDEIQILKGGVTETADIMVINQSDKPGAGLMAQNILVHFGNTKKIYQTNSLTGEGFKELIEGIKAVQS